MTDLWHPQAEQVRAPESSWGRYTGGPYRGVLHTTETDNYPKSTKSYFGNNFWPHATIGLVDGKWHAWQHIPINRAARALQHPAGTVQTNNQSAVQCEIVWRAGKAKEMPPALMDGVRAWMRWVEETVGVKRRSPTFYGPDAGFTLASSSARQRMTAESWKAFDGWCGHQHVPANSHWDPGAIDIKALLGGANEEDEMTDEQRDYIIRAVRDQVTEQIMKEVVTRIDKDIRPALDRIEAGGAGGGASAAAIVDEVAERLNKD